MTEDNSSQQISSEYTLPCSECHSGVMRLNYITYFTWLDEELVTVPNFPAWVCDVCGRREYDTRHQLAEHPAKPLNRQTPHPRPQE